MSLADYGDLLFRQNDPECLHYYLESLDMAERHGDKVWQAQRAGGLGNAYQTVTLASRSGRSRALVPA